MKVMLCGAKPTVTLWFAEAAAYTLFATTEAESWQAPLVRKFTVLPDTIHTNCEDELKTTGEVELVVTLSAADPSAVAPVTSLNVNVGIANTVKLWVTDFAAYGPLAATVAVIEQVPPAVLNVATFPDTVHADDVVELKVTVEVEFELALKFKVVPPVWVPIGAKVRVGTVKPCPWRVIDCVAAVCPKALSVKTALLVNAPVEAGVKLMLKLQDFPPTREVEAEQSAGMPLPATCAKLEPTLRPVNDKAAFPILETITDFGLSLLVMPWPVAA